MFTPSNPWFLASVRSDTRELLKSASVDDAYAFVDSNSHPRLWRNLAEHALEQLDFTTADKAFVRCADYQGIQFVKHLGKLDDKAKQRAEVGFATRACGC